MSPRTGVSLHRPTTADLHLDERLRRLTAERDLFRTLATSSTDAVSTADNNGVLTWVADSITDLLGWLPEEMAGRPFPSFVHEDDLPLLHEGLPSLLRGEAPRAEIRVRGKSGDWHWVSFMRKQIFAADGTPSYRVGGWRDIAEERAVRDALAASEERYRLLADNSMDIVFRLHEQVITWVSPSVTAALGGCPQDWLGRTWMDVVHPEDLEAAAHAHASTLDQRVSVHRARMRAVDGDYHWTEAHIGEYRNADGAADGWLVSVRVIDEQVETEKQLERLAQVDSLTGLLNHGEAMRRLEAALADLREPGEGVAVLFCDTDMFKHINDTLGHAIGDQVLIELTRRINDCLRRDDLVARLGGDEFLVVLRGVHAIEEVVTIAEKIRAAAAEPMSIAGRAIATSLSIGIALACPTETMDALLERADVAMYQAKSEGRNRVVTR